MANLPAPTIRPARDSDLAAIDLVHRDAFPGPDEAVLTAKLLGSALPRVSWVAEVDGRVVGHALLTPVTIDSPGGVVLATGWGLAPVAVVTSHQRRGVGTALLRGVLEHARSLEPRFVIVLGHPEYYRRFGFQSAGLLGLTCDFGEGDPFMILRFDGATLPAGHARYAEAFYDLPH